MGIRSFARAALVSLIGAVLLLGPLAQLPAQAEGSMTVTPNLVTEAPDEVILSGQCPGIDDVDGSVWPPTLIVTMVGSELLQEIALVSGRFAQEVFELPDDLPAGDYVFTARLPAEFEDDSGFSPEDFPACDPRATLTVLPRPVTPTLSLDRSGGEVGDTVTATGTCPSDAGMVELLFEDVRVGSGTVDPETGAFGPVTFAVPEVSVGAHDVTTTCDASADFEVLAPPEIPATLRLDPVSGRAGDGVTATGTCPVTNERVAVLFGDRSVASAAVDLGSGAFGPVPFPVPDVAAGPVRVTTDCGGGAEFQVLPPPAASPPGAPGTSGTPETPGTPVTAQPGSPATPGTPAGRSARPAPTTAVRTETPDGVLVVVPDLRGMTEEEAFRALGRHLTLVAPSAADGEIRRQEPAPGSLVAPASAVTVEMEPDPAFPWLLVGVLLAATAVAGLVTADRVRRRLREQRWLEEQVRTELRPQTAVLSVVPDHAVPGVDLRLEVRRHPARL